MGNHHERNARTQLHNGRGNEIRNKSVAVDQKPSQGRTATPCGRIDRLEGVPSPSLFLWHDIVYDTFCERLAAIHEPTPDHEQNADSQLALIRNVGGEDAYDQQAKDASRLDNHGGPDAAQYLAGVVLVHVQHSGARNWDGHE